ncbi:MAG: ABC transporter permease [Clostridiales bacterium]|jgi:fluoroquinolone transport system permease protein|nr:ABC transporter permease [Clostridiales bacterium]
MIYSDPAAIGLFFMGAVVLLEKSQRVLNALAVSPVKIHEYMIGKIVSLAAVSALAALFIALAAGLDNIPTVLAATVLTSAVFTLLGLTAAAKINSLNQYLIVIVPLEVICILPPIIFLFNQDAIARLYPLSASMALISGSSQNPPQDVLIILIIIACLFAAAYRSTVKMWKSCGGVKL